MAALTQGTKVILDSASANVTVKTAVDSGDSTTSPAHALIDAGTGQLYSPVNAYAAGSGFNRPGDTTAYALGDLIANSTTAGSVVLDVCAAARVTDQVTPLLTCKVEKTGTSITSCSVRVHVYNVAAPTFANGDNAAWSSNSKANYLGAFEVTLDKAFTDGACGIGYPEKGSAVIGAPISGTKNYAYCIEARGAYTPANAETFKATFGTA